jgi:hypothetical protein
MTGRPGMPCKVTPANPLPDNKMSNDTGDAAKDGYTVLSRASRYSGVRPSIGKKDEYPSDY